VSSSERCAGCGIAFAPTDAVVQLIARDAAPESAPAGHVPEPEVVTLHVEEVPVDQRGDRVLYEGPFAGLTR